MTRAKAKAKTKEIRMPGKERPAASRLVIQEPLRRSLTIGMLAKTRNPLPASPSGKPQRASITDSFGASPASSAWVTPQGATPAEREPLGYPSLYPLWEAELGTTQLFLLVFESEERF